jgi:uncharacterized protein YecT (DUF1311 family)
MRKACVYFSFFCTALLFAELTQAQPIPLEKPPLFHHACEDQDTPARKQECFKERAGYAQETLNRVYDQVSQRLENSATLTTAQNAWLSYRNKECAFESSLAEEAYRRTHELSCIARLTESRVLSLFAILSQTDYKRTDMDNAGVQDNPVPSEQNNIQTQE